MTFVGALFSCATITADEIRGSSTNEVLPMLTTAAEVGHLKRAEAQRGYPVRIRGVVTCIVTQHNAFVLQDNTRGVFIAADTLPEQIGESWEVEGVTDKGSFAPLVKARRKTFLGMADLPAPLNPTWDQIINGSLDDQLVEIRGVVESSQYDPGGWSHIKLRTQGGSLRVDLPGSDIPPDVLASCEKNLVRIQGCFFAKTDTSTWRVVVGQIRIFGAKIVLEQPGLTDPFSIPAKTIAELMRFDPRASAFQRVKVSGQIIHMRDTEHFMTDGTNGVRFIATPDSTLIPGDIVEVAGFPELSRTAPVLTEALVRKTGHAALPKPNQISSDDLGTALDSTLVSVEAVLTGIRQTQTNLVMEMQTGAWRFPARLKADKKSVPLLKIGSKLGLTGVCCAQDGYRSPGDDMATIALLLNLPVDIRVLSTPSWWTLQRLMVMAGILAFLLIAALCWVRLLHRQVEQRTAEVRLQIHNREQAEHLRAMEQERTRIAQDLHDELGSDIATISMLAARAKLAVNDGEKIHQHLDHVGGKAREMVAALDEIVWALNPAHDSLSSLAGYFGRYADRFLGLANIACKLETPPEPANRAVDSHQRHQLFMAFKEALTNVVRHSAATEVRVSIRVEKGELRVTVTDNGRGLSASGHAREMNGVVNMRTRLEKIGGRFQIAGEPVGGTTVCFSVPVN